MRNSYYKQLPQMTPEWRGIKINEDNFQIIVPVIANDNEAGLILIQTELFKLQEKMFEL